MNPACSHAGCDALPVEACRRAAQGDQRRVRDLVDQDLFQLAAPIC